MVPFRSIPTRLSGPASVEMSKLTSFIRTSGDRTQAPMQWLGHRRTFVHASRNDSKEGMRAPSLKSSIFLPHFPFDTRRRATIYSPLWVTLTNREASALTSADLQELFEVIYAANQAIGLADIRPAITAVLKGFFSAGGVCFFLTDEKSSEIDQKNVIGSGLNMGFLDRWVKYYYRLDPFLFEPARRAVVCKVDDLIPYTEWTKLEIYRDFYRPQKIHHKLSIFLRSGTKNIGLIGILRPKECPDFSEVEVEKARILAPHLTAALENWRFFSGIEGNEKQPQHRGRGASIFGIVVLDYDLRPVCWNSEAYELSRSGIGNRHIAWVRDPAEERLSIHPEILSDCQRLKAHFDKNEKVTAPRLERTVEIGPGRTFRVTSSLIEHRFSDNPTPGFVVGVMDLSKIIRGGEDGLRDRYGLTTRELEITQYVCQGMTNDEIGQKLYISRFTVETHLRNIFGKTGVKRRAGLAAILRSLPPIGAAEDVLGQNA